MNSVLPQKSLFLLPATFSFLLVASLFEVQMHYSTVPLLLAMHLCRKDLFQDDINNEAFSSL